VIRISEYMQLNNIFILYVLLLLLLLLLLFVLTGGLHLVSDVIYLLGVLQIFLTAKWLRADVDNMDCYMCITKF